MKKYDIKKISNDEFEIILEDGQVIKGKKDIKFLTEIQKINVNAKLMMKKDMKENNLTMEDFKKTVIINDKIVEDWSEYEEFRKSYFELAQQEMGLKMFKLLFNMDITDILSIMEMKEEEDINEFMAKILTIISGGSEKTPSK